MIWGDMNPTLPTFSNRLVKDTSKPMSNISPSNIKLALSFIISKLDFAYMKKFTFQICHLLLALLFSFTHFGFLFSNPCSLLELIVKAAVPLASQHIYKRTISSLCLASKTICCLRPFHEIVYSCE